MPTCDPISAGHYKAGIVQRSPLSCYPLISVIIPVYNRRNFLPLSVSSVLEQTYPAFEVIVVDDGSRDSCVDLLKSKVSQEVIFLRQSNKGVSSARNLGVSIARGEFIAFLDSDDQWMPEKLNKQMKWHHQNPGIKLSQTQEIWIRNGTRVNSMKKHKKASGDIFEKSLNICTISPSSLLIRKDLFLFYNGFDEDLPACEDYDLWLRITAHEAVGLIDEELIIKYGGHKDQLSTSFMAMDRFRVYSMIKLLLGSTLNRIQQNLALKALQEKIKILIHGAEKRGKSSQKFEELLKDFEKGSKGDVETLYKAKEILLGSKWK